MQPAKNEFTFIKVFAVKPKNQRHLLDLLLDLTPNYSPVSWLTISAALAVLPLELYIL